MGVLLNDTNGKNTAVIEAIEKLCGGVSLAKLIEDGRILTVKGERFVPEGRAAAVSGKDDNTLSVDESNVIEEIMNNGVFVFPETNGKEPWPVFINTEHVEKTAEGKKITTNQLTASDPIPFGALDTFIAFQLNKDGNFPFMDDIKALPEPGFFNRIWDSILGIFGSSTPEMDAYRANQAQLKAMDANLETAIGFSEKIEAQSEAIAEQAKQDAPAVKEDSMTKVTHLFDVEKFGYDVETMDVADLDAFNSFASTLKGLAENNYKTRAILLNIAEKDGLKPLYGAYKASLANGKPIDLKELFIQNYNKKEGSKELSDLEKILSMEGKVNGDNQTIVENPMHAR